MLDPIVRTIEVPCGQNNAFNVFADMPSWWPLTKRSMSIKNFGMPPQNASVVEVRFAPIDAKRTRVELTQSNWEAFGDMAEMMRGGYGHSWPLLFDEAYKSACGR